MANRSPLAAFALFIALATTVVVVFIDRHLYGIRAALLAGFFFLTTRATYESGSAVLHQPLAIFFGCATVLIFLLAVQSEADRPIPSAHKKLWALLGLLTTILFGGLGLPALLWYLLMRNYVSIHPFTLVLGAPFLAIASGVVLDKLWDLLNVPGRRSILWVMALVLPCSRSIRS